MSRTQQFLCGLTIACLVAYCYALYNADRIAPVPMVVVVQTQPQVKLQDAIEEMRSAAEDACRTMMLAHGATPDPMAVKMCAQTLIEGQSL